MDVLRDKSYKQYIKLSRYNNFPYFYHELDDKYIYGTTRNLLNTTPYVIHTVARNDSFDSIALKYYNNPTYFWVICDFNRIQDPYEVLEEGRQLKIPVFSSISFDM